MGSLILNASLSRDLKTERNYFNVFQFGLTVVTIVKNLNGVLPDRNIFVNDL